METFSIILFLRLSGELLLLYYPHLHRLLSVFQKEDSGWQSPETCLKRRMREVYRKNKRFLYDHLLSENIQIVFVIIMKGNTVADFRTIEKSINDVLRKLIMLTGKKEKIC